ncbi:Leucine-rich repeat receptor protein kinase MSP1 [Ananas comosus]|uniref:non-specific serine/threonine protein kinase n=1 Tax=Ananas comosus TaxID=4615 RepID=A0A199VU10_ANACO|nr:Leucine-rich repeat receptor protein kinase MSP1 [Ananas comosus]
MLAGEKKPQKLQTCLFFVSLIFYISISEAEDSTGDIKKLFTLRDYLSQNSASVTSWFDPETLPCNWLGITCSSSHTVQAIDLSYVLLTLPFPSCITEFRSLHRLNLSGCGFSGEVPETIGQLQNLQYLDLSKNQLSGSLPSSLFGLGMLKELLLGSNSFSGSLSPKLGELKALTKLSLSQNAFSGAIPPDLGNNLRDLELLDLSFNSFTGTLPPSFANLTKLLHLDLSRNSFTGPIFPNIDSLEYLLSLDLSSNNLIGTLPKEIGKLASIESLWLGPNSFSGSIPAEIGFLTKLKILSLQDCKLTGKIPREISNLKSLTDLEISENTFEGELPQGIGELKDLVYLLASTTGLSGLIPEQLGHCKKLKILDLSFNSFSDANRLSGEIPSKICESKSLNILSLSENDLTGSIEETFRECANLTDLILIGNNFYGEIPGYLGELPLVTLELAENNFTGELPDGLWKSSTIMEIYLSNNQLMGRIPEKVGELTGLQRLLLDDNFFEGSIPSSIGKLGNLTNLSLHGNRLSGGIPLDLFNCTNLIALDLGSNNLTGAIPKAISQLKLLDNLVLSDNRLSGEIPGEICDGFQQIAYPDSEFNQHYGVLDLSYNNLIGQIPAAIKNCAVLKELRLQGNMINGSIPPELAELSNLTQIDLSYNNLTGPVLPNLSPLPNLQGLILSNNQLSGLIPKEVGSILPSLVKLNLSSNSLTGPFPKSLFDIKTLTDVDISQNFLYGSIPFSDFIGQEINSLLLFNASNNNFSGTFPTSISNFTSLAVLDLHNNSLAGSLPISLSNLDYLTYLDLSNNNFENAIPCGICSIVGLSFVNFSGNRFDGFTSENCAAATNSCAANHVVPSVAYLPPRALKRSSVWGITIGIALGFVVLAISLLRWKVFRKKSLALVVSSSKAKPTAVEPASSDELLGKKLKEPLSINLATFEHALLRLTLDDILKATESFSKVRIIGDGGFGTVYKAALPEGRKVAIKRLHGGSRFQGDREFLAEMETIGKVKHRNLVPLLGYCVFSDERFLIYEYMENGSLEVWLRNRADAVEALSWPARFKICLGSARGLAFLHHGFVPHIIHRDMKSSNILLDESFEPRVSDFGLARIISACETHVSTDLAGTFGYIPPEYGLTMKSTAKGDVYSFGVVMLELLTGRAPIGQEEGEGGGNLVGWVRWMAGKGKQNEVFDPCLPVAGLWREQMARMLAVANACTADEPWKRPSMLEVVKMLKEIRMIESGDVVAGDL